MCVRVYVKSCVILIVWSILEDSLLVLVEQYVSGQVAFCVCANLGSHVVTVDPGEDVLHKLMSISKREAKIICVLSGSGVVSAVTLRQSNPYGDTMNYEGSFDILSLSGFFIPDDNGGMKSIFGNMNVSVAGPDGRVMGGELAGLLTAAAPVQVAITSCLPSYQEPKQFAPTSSCVHATGEGETQGASK
nr:PREDICTED: AT-hook motif nuclear-localized protein 1-like [Daucus carota subsp. sativus]